MAAAPDPGPLPEQTARMTITGIDDPELAKTRAVLFVRVRLNYAGRECIAFLAGHSPMAEMLKASEPFWVGKEVSVRVRIVSILKGSTAETQHEVLYNAFVITELS